MTDAEYLAMTFHRYYEELAPHFEYETRRESAVPWERVPERNKLLMIAVAEKLLNGHVRIIEKESEEKCLCLPTGNAYRDCPVHNQAQ